MNSKGKVINIVQNPVNKNILLFHGVGKMSWVTNDCGKTIKVVNHGKRALRFAFHPSFENYVLGLFEPSNCSGRKCKESGNLAYSKDWGLTWTIIRREVMDFGW